MGRAASCGFLPRSAKNALAPAIARAIYSAMTSTASVHLQGILGHMYALRRLYLDYVLVSPNTSYVSSKRLMRPYKIWPPPTTRPPRPSAESQVSHFHTSGRHFCNNHQIPGGIPNIYEQRGGLLPRKSTLYQTPTCVRRVSGRWKLIDYTLAPKEETIRSRNPYYAQFSRCRGNSTDASRSLRGKTLKRSQAENRRQ